MKPSLKALSSNFTGRGYVLETDLWPDTAVVQLRRMRIGDGWAAVLLLVGYPASLPLGWLEFLVGNHARIETSIHINGLDPATAGSMLQRRRARFESQRMYAANRGKLDDPNVEAAAADAADFAGRIARGESQLHAQAVYVTVHALTTEELDIACARLRAGTAAAMLDLRPASARQLPGLFATRPAGFRSRRSKPDSRYRDCGGIVPVLLGRRARPVERCCSAARIEPRTPGRRCCGTGGRARTTTASRWQRQARGSRI